MDLINTSALANMPNASTSAGYGYIDVYSPLNATGYGLVQSSNGTLILNPKTPAYVFGEQLRLLVDNAIDISAPVFSKLGQAASALDRVFTRALTIFPGASAEKVTEACNSVLKEEFHSTLKEEFHSTLKPKPKFPPLTFTDNNLVDVIRFIEDKNIVVLHTTEACRIFHSINFDQSENQISLENHRVVYLDCNSHPGLLGDGEWEWYIKDYVKGVKELSYNDKELRDVIIDQRSVPNKEYISLGY